MSGLDEIAPRLARAHRAEMCYQERLRRQRQHGYISLDIAVEEMIRSMRIIWRTMASKTASQAMNDALNCDIRPGSRLWARGADGHWYAKVATSAVEGCYVNGKLTHDFAGVYVRAPDYEGEDGMFWPLEDVEVSGQASSAQALPKDES